MNAITTKACFIRAVIAAARKHPLQIVIQSPGIWGLRKCLVFYTVDDDSYTPALLVDVKTYVKIFATEINFFRNLCLHSLCVFNLFTYSNLLKLLIMYRRLCFYHRC